MSRWQLSDKITTIADVHVRGRSTYFAPREAARGSLPTIACAMSCLQPTKADAATAAHPSVSPAKLGENKSIPTPAWPNPAPGYNSHMGCTYSTIDNANPDAGTQIAT
jgi:hypothetical protein